uniref:Methyltransferase type 11 domain-containing protein n=1 Tax=Mola mola TaxID=94237 RepID=A0A3Q4AR70_MOLML
MAYRAFEGKNVSSIYHKFRFVPPDEMKNIIVEYLDQMKGPPHVLAVDLGCGTGQNSRLLAPFFEEVVGMDISETQLNEARVVPGYPNITYRMGKAEELPFPDGSVDLLTASSAAHYFDHSMFLSEANRVLKPKGCLAVLDFTMHSTRFIYQDCGERLNHIYQEVCEMLLADTNYPVGKCEGMLEELYSAIPFPDKERIESIPVKSSISVSHLMGFIESLAMFQTYKKKDPRCAEDLLRNTQMRFLEEMRAVSPDTEIEHTVEYFCILASKPL